MEKVNENTSTISHEKGIPFNFYLEKRFKEDPELGKLPEDWEVKKIDDLFKVETGTTPSTKEPSYWDGGNINWFTPMDLSKLNGEVLIEESERKITRKALEKCNLTLMPKGSIIISTRAPVGYVAVLGQEGTFNQGCKGLIPKSVEKVHTLFYAYYLLRQKQKLENLSGGSTFKELSKTMLENFEVPCPPPEEQKMVVEVLSSVDLAIKKIDEAIAQAERLKRGLMQQLLTKGIGHTEFKETPIGKIPKDWKVVRLGEIAEIVMGQSPPSNTYNEKGEGLPFLQGKMEFGDIYPSPVMYCSNPIKIAETNDILISVRAPVGDVNLAPYRLCIGRGLAAIRFNAQIANYLFYFYYLQKIKNHIEILGKGSTFKAINKDDLESLRIPLPQPQEQQKVAETLFSIDNILCIKQKKKKRLVRMKHKLMDLLLTGRVRVSL
jgi:type I restriction enzyme S subunit